MAVIKRLNEYGPVQNTRRVVNTPTPEIAGAATGRALQELGDTVGKIALQTEKAKQDSDIALNDIKAREDLDKARREIETNPDIRPEDYEQTWNAKSKEVLDKYGANLKSNYAATAWQERAQGYQSDGVVKIRDTKRRREIESVKASMIEAGTAYERQASDIAIPETDVAKTRDAYESIVRTQYANGLLTKDEVAEKMAASESVARAGKTTRVSSNIDALVTAGRIGEARAMLTNNASLIDPKTRDSLSKALDQSEFDQITVTKGDELWTQAKGDFGSYMKLAAKETNAKQRIALEGRGAQLKTIDDKAEQDRQEGFESLIWKHVQGGGKIGNAPVSILAAIDPNRLSSIRAYENSRDAEVTMSPSQKAALEVWSSNQKFVFTAYADERPAAFMGGYQSWPDDMRKRFDGMKPDDQLSVLQDMQKMSTQSGSASEAQTAYNVLLNEAKRAVPEWKLGSDADEKTLPSDSRPFSGVLRGFAETAAKVNGGKPLSVTQARDYVTQALQSYQPEKWGTLPGRALLATPWGDQKRDYGAEQQIRDDLYEGLGRAPTDAEVQRALSLKGG